MKGIKNILLGLLLLTTITSCGQGFTLGNRVLMGSTMQSKITLASTSVLVSWSPTEIINTGTTLDWTVSGDLTIAKTTIDDPDFDFSTNTGTANILVENTNDLTTFNVNSLSVTSIDISESTALTSFSAAANSLTAIDFTKNTLLTFVSIANNSIPSADSSNNTLLTSYSFAINSFTTVDISNNTSLIIVIGNNNSLTDFDISNNTLLTSVTIGNNSLTQGALDQIYIDLDNHGLSSGILNIDSGRTAASDTARANLITKSWTIND